MDQRMFSSIQYPKDIAPPAAPAPSPRLLFHSSPLSSPLSLFFQVLGWLLPAAAALLPAIDTIPPPLPSLSLQVQSPPPPFIPADCKRGFSPLDEKKKQAGWVPLVRSSKAEGKMNALLCVSAL